MICSSFLVGCRVAWGCFLVQSSEIVQGLIRVGAPNSPEALNPKPQTLKPPSPNNPMAESRKPEHERPSEQAETSMAQPDP